ncbi:hypothetical protein PIB30_055699, partial [Stylosanthes scabra]|nr:hypothetical protein [Stylosanthes scabra]
MPECQPSVPHTLPSSENPSSSPTLHRRRNSVVAGFWLVSLASSSASSPRVSAILSSPASPRVVAVPGLRRRCGSSTPFLRVFDAVPVFDD